MEKLHELIAARAKAFDALSAFNADEATLARAKEKDFDQASDDAEFARLKGDVEALDKQIERKKAEQELAAKSAQPAPYQERPAATPETDEYVKDKSLIIGGVAKMLITGGGNLYGARQSAKEVYGESHPVTKSLLTSVASAAGILVPPDQATEVIELLRAQAVVRAAGPRNMPMPRGTMTLPGQASAATASYSGEGKKISKSQQGVKAIVASYKKLTALVPISNDMMRYASPAIDAFVRDDLVQVMALREDLAFVLGDGTQDTPRGFLSFASGWAATNGGTAGAWSRSANSVLAVNGADPDNSTGGNFITSNPTYTIDTVGDELGGAINRLDTANAPDKKRCWFFSPRTYNYLNNLRNSLGLYVYRDELTKGTLLGYPFKKTTQIFNNFWNADGSHKDLSFIFLVDMTEDIVLDSMQLELAVSREGVYYDENGVAQSAFQNDETVIRAIAEHDHQLRHDQSVAVIQGVRWSPAIQ